MCNGINNRKRKAVDPGLLDGMTLEQHLQATASRRASSSQSKARDNDRRGDICIRDSVSKKKKTKEEQRRTLSRHIRIANLPKAPFDDERLNPETLISFLNEAMQQNHSCCQRPVLNCLVVVHAKNGAMAFVGLESQEMAARALDLQGISYHCRALAISLPK
jgi:hypothetical protein